MLFYVLVKYYEVLLNDSYIHFHAYMHTSDYT